MAVTGPFRRCAVTRRVRRARDGSIQYTAGRVFVDKSDVLINDFGRLLHLRALRIRRCLRVAR